MEKAITDKGLYVVAALSGNRNFDGRINPLAKGAFLMSPMLVVAYALAGNIDFDFFNQPLGAGRDDGKPVYLKDLWPSLKEIKEVAEKSLSRDLYKKRYADALVGDEKWDALSSRSSATFPWDESSTYVRNPPWFESQERRSEAAHEDIRGRQGPGGLRGQDNDGPHLARRRDSRRQPRRRSTCRSTASTSSTSAPTGAGGGTTR